MIVSFGNAGTEDIFYGRSTRAARRVCPSPAWPVAARKLDQLDSADDLRDLRHPPGNRLERLRINDQYRICFTWTEAGPESVEIVDYH
ncbi:MAG: proteic killer suppression protein [Candidatus Latescibacterota bacterium]|jgi:proteic killer suppression protein